MDTSELIIYAIVSHLVADWLLQNDWMAKHKSSLLHPAAWQHGGIHFLAQVWLWGALPALLLTALHMLIDTRIPLQWWRDSYKQTQEGEAALIVAIMCDQTLHVLCIVLVTLLM